MLYLGTLYVQPGGIWVLASHVGTFDQCGMEAGSKGFFFSPEKHYLPM